MHYDPHALRAARKTSHTEILSALCLQTSRHLHVRTTLDFLPLDTLLSGGVPWDSLRLETLLCFLFLLAAATLAGLAPLPLTRVPAWLTPWELVGPGVAARPFCRRAQRLILIADRSVNAVYCGSTSLSPRPPSAPLSPPNAPCPGDSQHFLTPDCEHMPAAGTS